MAKYLLKGHRHDRVQQARVSRNPFVRFQIAFERSFENLRDWYHGVLRLCLEVRAAFLLSIVAFWIVSVALLYPWLGQDFFPSVDGGQFKLHVRAHTGTASKIRRGCAIRSSSDPARDSPSELGTVIDKIRAPT